MTNSQRGHLEAEASRLEHYAAAHAAEENGCRLECDGAAAIRAALGEIDRLWRTTRILMAACKDTIAHFEIGTEQHSRGSSGPEPEEPCDCAGCGQRRRLEDAIAEAGQCLG